MKPDASADSSADLTAESASSFYLPIGLPVPVAEPDGLSAPYWQGLRAERLLVQRCGNCATWQFGPEWLCHHCHAFDPAWQQVEPHGVIFSWERVWHPSHPRLAHGTPSPLPYLVVLVELPQAGKLRMLGNLLGDPLQPVTIGAPVRGVFEHHPQAEPPYSLLQWQLSN